MTSQVMSAKDEAAYTGDMTKMLSAEFGAASGGVGELLKGWRTHRRRSQLDLALDAGVSTRHLSCVETGKARPSRELIEQLAETLEVPLRARNALLMAGGFAPTWRETPLDGAELAGMQRAIDLILQRQEPYPAFVTNRCWDVLAVNGAMERMIGRLRGGPPLHANILHQVFDPADMRGFVENWEEVAHDLLAHLEADLAASPSDARLQALADELAAYPGARDGRRREGGASRQPLMQTRFRRGDLRLSFFSTVTTFAGARDVTLDEVRIECMFPADEETAAACERLARGEAV